MHNKHWIVSYQNEDKVYDDTIFNYGYVMKYVRDTKLNTLFSSSKDDVDKEIAGISESSNQSNHSN